MCRCCSLAINNASAQLSALTKNSESAQHDQSQAPSRERIVMIEQNVEGKIPYPQERDVTYLSCVIDPTDHLASESLFVIFSQFGRAATSVKAEDMLGWGSKFATVAIKPVVEKAADADWQTYFGLSGFTASLIHNIAQHFSFNAASDRTASLGSDGHKVVVSMEIQSPKKIEALSLSITEAFSGTGVHSFMLHKKGPNVFDVAFVIPVKASVATRSRTLRAIFVINDDVQSPSAQDKKTA